MSLRETIGVLRSEKKRLKVFVDFWNVVINARNQTTSDYPLDVRWDKLVDQIVGQTRSTRLDDVGGELAGCYIFGSYQKSDPKQNDFVSSVLDEYGPMDGLYFEFKERVPKQSAIRCKKCDEPVSVSSESGIDVLLTVEMVKHAAMREHDYLALVSSDRDFVPLLQYLRDEGHRVLHIATSQTVREMRASTWKQVDLQSWYPSVCRLAKKGYVILTTPLHDQDLAEAENLIKSLNVEYKIIDLTDKRSVSDKDLSFLVKNHGLGLSARERRAQGVFARIPLFQNAWDLREKLKSGEIVGHIPYIIRDGLMEAYADRKSQYRWIMNGASDAAKMWQALQTKPGK